MALKKYGTVVIAATIAATLLVPLSTVVTDSTGDVTVENETVVADNSFKDLEGYNIDSSTVTVTDSDGNNVDSGNFTVREDSGEIRIDNSSSTVVSDGEEVDVDYTYQATDDTTATVANLVPLLAVLLVLVTIAAKVQGAM